ncbi:MAG: hypothetical protein ACREYF_24530 [Gammaproteobacteria bacterium]
MSTAEVPGAAIKGALASAWKRLVGKDDIDPGISFGRAFALIPGTARIFDQEWPIKLQGDFEPRQCTRSLEASCLEG